MSRRSAKHPSEQLFSDAMLRTALLFADGMHDHRPEPEATKPVSLPDPYLEDIGAGWYKIHGSPIGPFDRHGKAEAEAALAAVIRGRKAGAR